MRVYKFGGASVKDAEGVKSLGKIVQSNFESPLVVVVSAMGKMTNAFEEITNLYFGKQDRLDKALDKIRNYHLEVIDKLFLASQDNLIEHLEELFSDLKLFFRGNFHQNRAFVYDQIVVYGELLCTKIIHHYLNSIGLDNVLIDSRKCIKTDSYFRDANLNWQLTIELIKKFVHPKKVTLAQGFIASDLAGNSTTLGREGSDYTAAIFGYALDAQSVTVWKDVRGIMNGNPKIFDPTVLLKRVSYREAIELAYYGASVIHPKTIQPVQRKKIPFFVRSFQEPHITGTKIGLGHKLKPKVSCFIKKENLVLLKISTLDFSFLIEKNISEVFALLDSYQMRVELTQNSAISFSVCFSNKYRRLIELISVLKKKFKVVVYRDVMLYTIRHFDQQAIDRISKNGKRVLLEQRTLETAQFVCI